MNVLDCRGLPCPEPVIRCRDWLATVNGAVLEVLVDNPAAVENVSVFLSGRGWTVDSRREGDAVWRLSAVRDEAAASSSAPSFAPAACSSRGSVSGKVLVFIPTETLGRGDEDLGARLMVNFLGSLSELGSDLWRIVLVNGGVKLSAGGPALEKLQTLEAAGVSILVCGTCLDHYGLLERKQVGSTTNMLDIVTSLHVADKVIRP